MSPPSQPILGRPVPLSDSLRIAAGAARGAALFPEFFPIPDPVRHLVWQRESELIGEHTHLPAMVGFVRKHLAQHFQANRPRPSPAISTKLLYAAPTTAERFSEHLRAGSGALRQSHTGLLRRAVRAVEVSWNLYNRCGTVSLTHLGRTLCMCVKIAAMVRALPGGLARQAVGSRCSIRTWLMRSLAAKIRTAARPS